VENFQQNLDLIIANVGNTFTEMHAKVHNYKYMQQYVQVECIIQKLEQLVANVCTIFYNNYVHMCILYTFNQNAREELSQQKEPLIAHVCHAFFQ
jgi:hypothetical protein